MRITHKIARAIKAACREACGGRRKVEVGDRFWPGNDDCPDNAGYNFLLWGADNDLSDVSPVDDLVGQDIPTAGGWIALDCYCYNLPLFGVEPGDALDCNVYVLMNAVGEILYATSDDRGHTAAINEILIENGHPGYCGVD